LPEQLGRRLSGEVAQIRNPSRVLQILPGRSTLNLPYLAKPGEGLPIKRLSGMKEIGSPASFATVSFMISEAPMARRANLAWRVSGKGS
jgi:hypothetical protein